MSIAAIAGVQFYESFIKCGEILKSPPQTSNKNFVFRCIVCKETFMLMSAFIIHSDTHKSSKKLLTSKNKSNSNKAIETSTKEEDDKSKAGLQINCNVDEVMFCWQLYWILTHLLCFARKIHWILSNQKK